jgi:hypothetical protein
VFEYKVFRKMFGPMKDEISGQFRITHSEESLHLYISLTIVKLLKSKKMDWTCSLDGETTNEHRIIVWKERS